MIRLALGRICTFECIGAELNAMTYSNFENLSKSVILLSSCFGESASYLN